MTIQERVKQISLEHGGLRSASRILGIDPSYLQRLGNGKKTNPGEETLDKLGLKKQVTYVLK